MKYFSLVAVTALAMNVQAASSNNAKYLTLSKVKVTDVTAQYPAPVAPLAQAGMQENCDSGSVSAMEGDKPHIGLNPIDQAELIVDQIINIGKKIWTVVDAGRPVVNVQSYTANALPKGLKCWSDLTGWQTPRSKVYRVEYENALGATVVDFAYRVTYTAGGSVNGQGQYITNATIMPAELDVSWGYTFNANAEVPSVFNTGTHEEPVAGMQMNMKWSVDTVLDHAQQAESYYIGGNNILKHLQ